MDYGVALFPTEYSIQPVHLARLAEEREFESLWFTEHTHIPVSRETPWPGGGELPREYSHIYDPFVALSFAASVTERIKIGTGVCLVNQHDVIALAKATASLDRLSGGRFLFGVGAGWNREEMADHGIDPRRRFSNMRERVEATSMLLEELGSLTEIEQWDGGYILRGYGCLLGEAVHGRHDAASQGKASTPCAVACSGRPVAERHRDRLIRQERAHGEHRQDSGHQLLPEQ